MNDRKEYLIPEKDKQGRNLCLDFYKYLLLSVSFTLLLSGQKEVLITHYISQ